MGIVVAIAGSMPAWGMVGHARSVPVWGTGVAIARSVPAVEHSCCSSKKLATTSGMNLAYTRTVPARSPAHPPTPRTWAWDPVLHTKDKR